jgi:hypothetical protein
VVEWIGGRKGMRVGMESTETRRSTKVIEGVKESDKEGAGKREGGLQWES